MTAIAEKPQTIQRTVPLYTLAPPENNYRKTKQPEADEELARSIAVQGVLQPLLVRPLAKPKKEATHEVVNGSRRLAALRRAVVLLETKVVEGERTVSDIANVPVQIREMSDVEAAELQLVENVQRVDVHPIEEGDGFAVLIDKHKYDVAAIARTMGKSESYVRGRLKLATMEKSLRTACLKGELSMRVANLIARVVPNELQKEACNAAVRDVHSGWSETEVCSNVLDSCRRMEDAKWQLDDAELVPAAGPCSTCPKRSQNDKLLYSELSNGDVCTDGACWATKLEAYSAKVLADAKASGGKIVEGKAAKKILADKSSVNVDYVVDHDKSGKPITAGAVAKKAKIQPTTVVDHKGEVSQVVDSAALAEHTPAARPRRALSAAESARNKRERDESRLEAAVLECSLAKADQAIFKRGGWSEMKDARVAWLLLIEEFWSDLRRAAATRRGLSGKNTGKHPNTGGDALKEWASNATAYELQALVFELLVRKHSGKHVNGVKDATELLSMVGVDRKKCVAEAKRSLAEPKEATSDTPAPAAAESKAKKPKAAKAASKKKGAK